MTWHILYRGSLSSCNYRCDYCPFAKTRNTREELRADAVELERFVAWVERQDRRIGVLFTPWGEALIRRHYQKAMLRLGDMPHVYRVAVQTNLSCDTAWLSAADRESVALWLTFHPGETERAAFVAKCCALTRLGIRFSVGVVGLREHFDDIDALRAALPPAVYVWVNAFKRVPDYYQAAEVERIRRVDPYFDLNRRYHPSRGKACEAGHTSFTVDGTGTVRRCHFIAEPIGNIYDGADLGARLEPRPCTNAVCGCHIGYVHRPELALYELFGDGLLERIPARWPIDEVTAAADRRARALLVHRSGEPDEGSEDLPGDATAPSVDSDHVGEVRTHLLVERDERSAREVGAKVPIPKPAQ